MTAKTELINFYSQNPKLENSFSPAEETFLEALEKKSALVQSAWIRDVTESCSPAAKLRIDRMQALLTGPAPVASPSITIKDGQPVVFHSTPVTAGASSATVVRRINNDDDDEDDKPPKETHVVKLQREPPPREAEPKAAPAAATIVNQAHKGNDDDEEYYSDEEKVLDRGHAVKTDPILMMLQQIKQGQDMIAARVTKLESGSKDVETDLSDRVATAIFSGSIVETASSGPNTVQVPVSFTIDEGGKITAQIVIKDIISIIGPKVNGPVRCSARSIKNQGTRRPQGNGRAGNNSKKNDSKSKK